MILLHITAAVRKMCTVDQMEYQKTVVNYKTAHNMLSER